MARVYSEKEVSEHHSLQDAHPGGLDVLKGHLGADISHVLRSAKFHQHSRAAFEVLDQCCIGVLRGGPLHEDQEGDWSDKYKLWKEEDFVDWNKPMLSQVAQLGKHYKTWIHFPVHKQLRLFHSDVLELFSVCPWWLIPLFWIPCSVFMMWLATTKSPSMLPWASVPQPLSGSDVLSLLPIGFLLWTLLEYFLHRFVFHMEPWYTSGFSLQFHFIIHGQHHKVPFDKTRLVFPLLPAAFVAVLLYMIFSFTFNLAELRALYAGGILGYITYEMIHYYLHHGSPPPGSYFAGLKSHHVAHHYINPKRGYGVSSKVWDMPFGTKF